MTVKEVATIAGCSRRAVLDACVRCGFKKKVPTEGGNLMRYELTKRQVDRLLDRELHYKRGRPRKVVA